MPANLLRSWPKTKAASVEPMDCLPVPQLPEGLQWFCEMSGGESRRRGDPLFAQQENLEQEIPVHYLSRCAAFQTAPLSMARSSHSMTTEDQFLNLLQNFTSESGRVGVFRITFREVGGAEVDPLEPFNVRASLSSAIYSRCGGLWSDPPDRTMGPSRSV